jgi:hypothetical protein
MRAISNAPGVSFRGPPLATCSLTRRAIACVLAACVLAVAMSKELEAANATRDMDPAIAAAIRQLDCTRMSADDVRTTLSHAPAPRIVLLQGSVAVVTMEPFAKFLIDMGYPADRLRNPRDGLFSYSSHIDSATLAGELAFDYEQSGLAPMLIGHSQGGMLAIRTLYELAGAFHDALHVVDPTNGNVLARTSIVDPRTRESRPVVGLRVSYATALATGWLPRLLLGQWTMLPRLRQIPDTVDEFTGFTLPNDPIAGTVLGDSPYVSLGRARVRNVVLPRDYHHVALPRVAHLPANPAIRRWIDAWSPDAAPASPAGDTTNLVHAADIWYSVKRHWCLQAQRLLNASA